MREKSHSGMAALAAVLTIAGYFGAYFFCANYFDFGINRPHYVLRYSAGPVDLDPVAFVFEPARRIDDLLFRHRHANMPRTKKP